LLFRRSTALLLAVVLAPAAGCGNLFSHWSSDAGSPPGPDAAQPGDSGHAVDAGADAGSNGSDGGDTLDSGSPIDSGSTDAGSPSDSGTPDDAGALGDGGSFSWGTNLAGSGDYTYAALAAFAEDDAYLGGTNAAISYLFHWDGQHVTPFALIPSANFVTALWVSPGGAVFAGEANLVFQCLSNCSDAGSYTEVSVDSSGVDQVAGLCGSSSAVYAVGFNGGTSGLLWQWMGSQWELLNADSGVARFMACWVAPDGSIYAGGQPSIVQFAPGAVSWSIEGPSVAQLGGAEFQFRGITGAAGLTIGVGDDKTVAVQQTDGGWSVPLQMVGGGAFDGIATVAPNEAYAVGLVCPSCANSPQDLGHGFQGSWSLQDLPLLIDVHGIWPVDANTLLVAGQQRNSSGGVDGAALFVGRR
jgi:hypothetical protein